MKPEAGPSPLVAGPLPLEAGPSPLEAGPLPLVAGPLPLEAGPSPLEAGPLPLATGPLPPAAAATPLVAVRDLQMHFPLGGLPALVARLQGRPEPVVRAVESVSFDVAPGETLALVGESGCGKSTVARCVLRLLDPTSGSIRYDGTEIATLDRDAMRALRRDIQMVYQDPTASLNPRLTARRMVDEALMLHTGQGAGARRERVDTVFEEVGLGRELADRYPHELSGGQRQRVNIARAIATNPRFVVLDEPTSALDVSLRSRIILLLEALRARHGLSYLFISHDLASVKYLAGRVAVMYLGVIVELAPTQELFARPLHPYTRALLAAVPVPDPDAQRDRFVLEGEIPSPMDLPSGCRLRGRCPIEQPVCAQPVPLREVAPGRFVACHLASPERKVERDPGRHHPIHHQGDSPWPSSASSSPP